MALCSNGGASAVAVASSAMKRSSAASMGTVSAGRRRNAAVTMASAESMECTGAR
ncbi:MAG: hypothetical protein R3A78_14560 [Polyangiales bacterium]